MTREEAVMVLNMVEAHGVADKAKRMAIKALEFDLDKHDEEVIKNTVETLWGEPCEDCISREAVLDACDQSINIFDATDRIKELPSVKPKVKECEDCISREAAIKVFGDVHPMDYNTQAYITNIQNLPSVIPEQETCECTEHPCLGKLCRYYKQPCDDAISRQAVLDKAWDVLYEGKYIQVVDVGDIQDLPPVKPQQKTGYWIKMGEGFTPYQCSECEKIEFKKSKYCPNCGCRMMESEEV